MKVFILGNFLRVGEWNMLQLGVSTLIIAFLVILLTREKLEQHNIQ